MEQFTIKENGFAELRKPLLIKLTLMLLLIIFGSLAISYFSTNNEQNNINTILFLIPLVLIVLGFSLYRSINKLQETFESYKLTIEDNSVTREQKNTPTITILNSEITEIVKNSNGSLTIKTNSILNHIGVPYQMNDFLRIEKTLSEVKQISIMTKKPFLQNFIGLVYVLPIGLMAAIYLSQNKVIVGICGIVLLIVLGYSFFEMRRSKHIDNTTKKGLWWIFVVIASIIGIMYSKLTGQL
ncbi:MAG: hypothetical protein ABL940_03970 [Bacteroidia bacterium]|jgi:uncharacterized membrane protein SirB2